MKEQGNKPWIMTVLSLGLGDILESVLVNISEGISALIYAPSLC